MLRVLMSMVILPNEACLNFEIWAHPKTLLSSSARLWRLVIQAFGPTMRSRRGRSFSQHERFRSRLRWWNVNPWPTGMCIWHVNVQGQSIADIFRTSSAWKGQIKTNKSELWRKPWRKERWDRNVLLEGTNQCFETSPILMLVLKTVRPPRWGIKGTFAKCVGTLLVQKCFGFFPHSVVAVSSKAWGHISWRYLLNLLAKPWYRLWIVPNCSFQKSFWYTIFRACLIFDGMTSSPLQTFIG